MTGTSQRATLIALTDGAELAEHDSPLAATLYVVTGRVRLHTHDNEWTLDRGHLAAIPPDPSPACRAGNTDLGTVPCYRAWLNQ
ncbi:hypothetical protein [Amycolatopsis sp. YIM 10]|uniref:hypothetical protein n=1 Tax=Amycolatopsis sp. YIM 10 TaxID=2653857 RepID=UPI003519F993